MRYTARIAISGLRLLGPFGRAQHDRRERSQPPAVEVDVRGQQVGGIAVGRGDLMPLLMAHDR